MSLVDSIGYLAASLVLATFWMRRMQRLRLVAIGSNLAFIAYGSLAGLTPVLLLHCLLLPLNLVRALQVHLDRNPPPPQRSRRRAPEPRRRRSHARAAARRASTYSLPPRPLLS